MTVQLDKDVQIPTDALVRLSTAGVLGETFIDIDIRQTSGPPIQSGGTLRSVNPPSIEDVVEAVRKKTQ